MKIIPLQAEIGQIFIQAEIPRKDRVWQFQHPLEILQMASVFPMARPQGNLNDLRELLTFLGGFIAHLHACKKLKVQEYKPTSWAAGK